jgi:hypothetical protein
LTPLDYLLFDFSDEEGGAGSFDAMASVLPDRLPALAAEVEAVLRWAHREFGAPSGEEGEWDFELQAACEPDTRLNAVYDAAGGRLSLASHCDARTTLSLTLSGPASFCEAFRHAFPATD